MEYGRGKKKASTHSLSGVCCPLSIQSTWVGLYSFLEAGILKCMKDTFNLLYLAAIFFLIYGPILYSLLVGRITVALSVMLANKQWEGAKLLHIHVC